jgi:hypothetical protein
MSDDPQLRKMLAALIRRGASEEDLEAYTQEYEQAHRFANPALAARTAEGEHILPGAPRKESFGEKVAGTIGAGVQGLTLGESDELGGGAAALGALLPGGRSPSQAYRETRDAARQQIHGFQKEHPVVSTVAELAGGLALPFGAAKGAGRAVGFLPKVFKGAMTGGVTGGAYAFGKAEGTPEQQIAQTAQGTKLGGVFGGTLPAVAKLGRLFGFVSKGEQNQAALDAIESAITRSGQKADDVLARAEAFMTEHGRPPSLAQALGPAAKQVVIGMAGIGDEAAGKAATFARGLPEGDLAKWMQTASEQAPPKLGFPSAIGLKYTVPRAVLGRGLAKSARKESETTLEKLMGSVEGYLGPLGEKGGGVAPPVSPVQAQALESMLLKNAPVPPAGSMGELPVSGGNPNLATSANPSRMSEIEIARRNKLLGIKTPSVRPGYGAPAGGPSEIELEALAKYLADPAHQDENLETLLQMSLDQLQRTGSAGGLQRAKPPDPKVLRKILGMSGVLGLSAGVGNRRP